MVAVSVRFLASSASICGIVSNFFYVGQIFLLCKGAETAIFERVTEGDIEAIEKHVNDFAVVSQS